MNRTFRTIALAAVLLLILCATARLHHRTTSPVSPSSLAPHTKPAEYVAPAPPDKPAGKTAFSIHPRLDGSLISLVEKSQDKEEESRLARLRILASLPSVADNAQPLLDRDPHYGHAGISVSDDGKRAVFMEIRSADAKDIAILLYDFETGEYVNVAPDLSAAQIMHPAVSPDGTRVVFRQNKVGIWRYNVRTNTRELLVNDARATMPAFSPDGKYLTYNVLDRSTASVGFEIFDLAEARTVKSYFAADGASLFAPALSPDGTQLLYKKVERVAGKYTRSLVLESLATGDSQTIPMPHADFGAPHFSPDGKRIAYAARDTESSPDELYCLDLDSRIPVPVTSGQGNYPVWIGNTGRLAFMSARDKGISRIFAIDTNP
jgi:dipeptidyl aminopeptidase/acylaminoacyl peptidase